MSVKLTTGQSQAIYRKLREAVEGGGRSSGVICLEFKVRFLSHEKAKKIREEAYLFPLCCDFWVVTRVSDVEAGEYAVEFRRR